MELKNMQDEIMAFTTTHKIICGDSRQMVDLKNETIDLVVTSPPYPMIAIWDS